MGLGLYISLSSSSLTKSMKMSTEQILYSGQGGDKLKAHTLPRIISRNRRTKPTLFISLHFGVKHIVLVKRENAVLFMRNI